MAFSNMENGKNICSVNQIKCKLEDFWKKKRVGSSCSSSGTRRVNLVTTPVISHERGKEREVFTTKYLQTLLLKILHKEKNNIFIHQCLAIFALLHFWRVFTFDQLSSMNLKLVRSRTAIYAIKLDQKQKFKFKIYYRTM
jgi:hypothetical protein